MVVFVGNAIVSFIYGFILQITLLVNFCGVFSIDKMGFYHKFVVTTKIQFTKIASFNN